MSSYTPCCGLEAHQNGQQDLFVIMIAKLETLKQPVVRRPRKAFRIPYDSRPDLRFSLFILEDDEVNSLLQE